MGFKYEVDAEMAALSSRPSFHCPGEKTKITLFSDLYHQKASSEARGNVFETIS